MPSFKLTIISPRDRQFDLTAESLVAPGLEGEFGVLAGHAPMVALIKRGITRVTADGATRLFVTGQGFVEVAGDEVNLLADFIAKADSPEQAAELLAAHLKDVAEGPAA